MARQPQPVSTVKRGSKSSGVVKKHKKKPIVADEPAADAPAGRAPPKFSRATTIRRSIHKLQRAPVPKGGCLFANSDMQRTWALAGETVHQKGIDDNLDLYAEIPRGSLLFNPIPISEFYTEETVRQNIGVVVENFLRFAIEAGMHQTRYRKHDTPYPKRADEEGLSKKERRALKKRYKSLASMTDNDISVAMTSPAQTLFPREWFKIQKNAGGADDDLSSGEESD